MDAGLSRSRLLRRILAGALAAGGAGGGAGWRAPRGGAAGAKKPLPLMRFFSRPDLRPQIVTVLKRAAGGGGGYLFLAPNSGPGYRGTMIVDDRGELVWFHKTYPRSAMDFRVQTYRGKPVLTWWEGKYEEGIGQTGHYVIVDSSYREIARFRARNGVLPDFHEYALTDRGTALVTAHRRVPADLSEFGGRRDGSVLTGLVQELEIPSGRVLWQWSSVDHVGLDESLVEVGNPWDYFHVNSVAVDHDDHLVVSARNTSTVYKINRKTGEVMWRLGGGKSDFALPATARFGFQHDARPHDSGRLLSIFDNGPAPGRKKPESRAMTLRLDRAAKRATVVRQHRHTPPLFARFTGNAQLLPNGDMLVCWGITGWFTQLTKDGRVRLDAKLPEGGQNYRVRRHPWVGHPTQPPAVRRRRTTKGRTLHASWNGATEVASWRIHAGPRRAALTAGERVPRTGFETALPIPKGAKWAYAVALDRGGKALGKSGTIRV